MVNVLRFYLSPFGRISRRAYILAAVLPEIAIFLSALAIDEYLIGYRPFVWLGYEYGYAETISEVLLAWPVMATAIKRFHDIGATGWWVAIPTSAYLLHADVRDVAFSTVDGRIVLLLYVLLQIAVFLILVTKRGDSGRHRFGSNARAVT